ncbi:MAG: methionine--tRNA ligase, partial [Promethearchaeota archaeon]
ISPEELATTNHAKIKKLFELWNISYDNYTITHNPTHIKFVQDFYLQVEKNDFVTTKEEDAFYCESCKLWLPDRFVEGNCPHCNSEYARGDQCDSCGKLLEPEELVNPRCKHCHNPPITKSTKHWYLEFGKTETGIRQFVENNTYIPANARSASLNFIKDGLPNRSITRDLDWGIPAPFKGSEGKSIYVWFEAVLGYISAVKEWADKIKKEPSLFEEYWNDPETKTVFFVGKDNIIFHLIIFPGLLVAYNKNLAPEKQFVMPYNVSSTEFLNYENDKFSKSRNVGIWIDEALDLAPVEYWRYSLLRNRPEKQDTNFLWAQFEKDILELNNNIGNFIHRILSFIGKRYDAKIPEAPAEDALDDEDKKLIETIHTAPEKVGNLLEKFKLKEALNEIITIARQGNIYINNKAPWKLIKTDKLQAGYTFYLAIQLVETLGILLYPFIPSVSEKIFAALGNTKELSDIRWESAGELSLPVGRSIIAGKPLFEKLDVKALQRKLNELHGIPNEDDDTATSPKSSKKQKGKGKGKKPPKSHPVKDEISYDDFTQLDFRVGTVLEAELVDGAQNLLKLQVDVGESTPRTIVAGMAKYYTPEEIVGMQITVLVNLEPKEIRGILSHGMLLAADLKKKGATLLSPDKTVPNGSRIR